MKKCILILMSNLLFVLALDVHAAPDIDDVTMEMMDLDDRSSNSVTRTIEIPANDDRSRQTRDADGSISRQADEDSHDSDDIDDKDDDHDDDKDNDDSDDSIDDDGIKDKDTD